MISTEPLIALRRRRWVGPLAASLLALILSVWTFDPKLGLSGDNAEFIILARSMASGQGLTHINMPVPRVATRFPPGLPLMLAPVAAQPAAEGTSARDTHDFTLMKWVVTLSFLGAAAFLYLLVREMAGELFAIITSLAGLTTPLVVSYGHQVMSEVPYMMWSLLALWLLERGLSQPGWRSNHCLWGGVAAMIVTYYFRSVGICLIGAVILLLVIQRDGRRLLAISGTCLAAMSPWMIRNHALAGGSSYTRELLMVNPYRPEMGQVDTWGMLSRLLEQGTKYVEAHVPGALFPAATDSPWLMGCASVLLSLLALGTVTICVRRRQHLLTLIYAAFVLGTLFLWPWSSTRFLIPLIPILWFFVLHTGAAALTWVGDRTSGLFSPSVAAVALLLVVGANVNQLSDLARYGRADYPGEWRNYYGAGLWFSQRTPVDAVIACRKPNWMHVVANRKTIAYTFDRPDVLLRDLERQGVNYVVAEKIMKQTKEFLVPAMAAAPDRFQGVHVLHDPNTWILRFDGEPEPDTQQPDTQKPAEHDTGLDDQ